MNGQLFVAICLHSLLLNKVVKKCESFDLPRNLSLSQELLSQTLEIGSLDSSLNEGISFDGVHDLENILLICSKGGIAIGEDLLKVADTLRAARKLRKLIFDQVIRPRLSELLKDVATLPDLQKTPRIWA